MRTFTINDEQEKQFLDWRTEHRKTCKAKPDVSMALFSFIFTPSGLGDILNVTCPCGERKYLDDGEDF